MFGIFKKKPQGEITKIKIEGMHCTSCSMNIDAELEELDGVFSARTSYAKQEAVVEYDPGKVSLAQLHSVIKQLGYTIQHK